MTGGMMGGGLAFLGACLVVAAFIVMSVRIYQVRPEFMVRLLRYALVAGFGIAFSIVSIAIGFRIDLRHSSSYSSGLKSVQEIWGGQAVQESPSFSYAEYRDEQYEDQKTGQLHMRQRLSYVDMGFEAQDLRLSIRKSVRKRGLLFYPGYTLNFSGIYEVKNIHREAKDLGFYFTLPSGAGNISGISVSFDGRPYAGDTNLADGFQWGGRMLPGEKHVIGISYSAQGTGNFSYGLAGRSVEIKRLAVKLETDFDDITVPEGAMVPTRKDEGGAISRYEWSGSNLVTGQNIALAFKVKGNYGEVVSRMFFHSPLAIFLFLGFLVVFGVARGIRLHPMQYLFMITAFFIFYLLGSYMVSYMHIVAAVIFSLAVSTALLLYYCYLLGRGRELVTGILFGAAMFQWIFSIAFFFPEHTGFVVTIASIVAFVALMTATAKVDWEGKW